MTQQRRTQDGIVLVQFLSVTQDVLQGVALALSANLEFYSKVLSIILCANYDELMPQLLVTTH